MSRLALLTFLTPIWFSAACHPSASPTLRVLGVNGATPTHEVVFVQVTNPAAHPMRLTKLTYTFAASGHTVAQGEMPLEREIEAGAAAIVEVPFEGDPAPAMILSGKLTAQLDRIEQTFQVSAQVVAK